MKTIVCIILLGALFDLRAQTLVEKRIQVRHGQQVALNFDYPKIVKITTWDRDEILVEGSVSINGGENNEAFELKLISEGNKVSVSNSIKNFDQLPRRITVIQNGQKLFFKNKAEFKAYAKGKPNTYEMWSENVDMEIELSIKVPANRDTFVESVYGMVEVTNFRGALAVNATYGGTDVTIQEKLVGQLNASTNYGQIYSNLVNKFDTSQINEENFHTEITAKLGNGPKYRLESQYGNVYLRKASSN